MAIDFPNSPTLNQTFTVGDRTWTWNGTSWKLTSYGVRGLSGIVTSATPPSDTSLLWADTATNSSAGIVPSGGTTGQALVKNSATNYDTTWASVGSAARPLLTGGAYLSGSGLVLSGLSGNYASAPDSAALSITGDLEIIVKFTPNWSENVSGWQPALSKTTGQDNNVDYGLYLNRSGTTGLLFQRYTATTGVTYTNTASTGFTSGTTYWCKAEFKQNNGSSQSQVTFYKSTDGTTYTTIGSAITNANTDATRDSTNQLRIGFGQWSDWFNGTIHRVIIKNGIGGSTVFDADFSTQTADALAFTESSSNAATVTINTTRYSYGVPGVQANVQANDNASANTDYFFPFIVTQSTVVDLFTFDVNGGPASDSTIYLGIYSATNNFQPTGSPISTASQVVATSATGAYRVAITPVTLTPGNYVIAHNNSVLVNYRSLRGGITALAVAGGLNQYNTLFKNSRTAAAFSSGSSGWNTCDVGQSGTTYWVGLRYKAA